MLADAQAWLPHVDLDRNVAFAESRRTAFWPGDDIDLYNLVDYKGAWDFKKYGSELESFGNFHYGLVGSAAGYSRETLLRMAGWAQRVEDGKMARVLVLPTGIGPYLGLGGEPPFGDHPNDQYWIEQGITYYDRYYRKRATRGGVR